MSHTPTSGETASTLPGDDAAVLVRRFFEAQDAGDLAVIDRCTSGDFRLYAAGAPPLDREGLRAFSATFYGAFPDLHHSFLRQVTSDGLVASHVRLRGTQRGEFQGIPATGASIDVTAMQFTRVKDGRLVAHWTVIDRLGLMEQLGVRP